MHHPREATLRDRESAGGYDGGGLNGVAMITRLHLRIAAAVLVGLLLAGCDKCGNRVKFEAPTLPGVCGENADPAK